MSLAPSSHWNTICLASRDNVKGHDTDKALLATEATGMAQWAGTCQHKQGTGSNPQQGKQTSKPNNNKQQNKLSVKCQESRVAGNCT